MAGHSKWAQIKHKKEISDIKRGELFSKIAKTIIVAVKNGDVRPETNSKLRLALEKARRANMPRDIVERALNKAQNKNDADLEEFLYAAYGPEGSAFLIEGITDNTNRTTQEIKHIITKHEGKFALPETVLWLFEKMGVLEIPLEKNKHRPKEALELMLIDLGANSIKDDGGMLLGFFNSANIQRAHQKIINESIIENMYYTYIPKMNICVSKESELKIKNFLQELRAHDDVQDVYSNISLL